MSKTIFMAAVLAFSSAAAYASTITVTDVTTFHQYQQTTNSPCVFDNNSCSQPAGFPAALLPVASSYDQDSLTYTVSQIRAVVGNSFFVGMDVNQDGNADQKLSLFSMSINGVLTDSTNIAAAGVAVPPTTGGGNGNGFADYILTGFTSLAGLDGNATVTFHVTMPLVNDGREQFFLLANGTTATPEPVTLALTGSGLIGLLVLRKRFAKR